MGVVEELAEETVAVRCAGLAEGSLLFYVLGWWMSCSCTTLLVMVMRDCPMMSMNVLVL